MFEYEVRAGTAPQGVRLAWHHRFVPVNSWANMSLQQRAEMFDELEAEFLAMLATAPTAEIQIGANSWRAIPHTSDQLRLEVSGPVYQPPKQPALRPEEMGATPRDYAMPMPIETRPISTAESAGAATRALIMAANELAVAVRVMIGDSELHVLHRPVEQLERCLAAWPDEVAHAEARTEAVRDACDQIQRLANQPLMKLGVHDTLRVRLEQIMAGLTKTFDLQPPERYWTFVKVPAGPTTEQADQPSPPDGPWARVTAETREAARSEHLARVSQLLAQAIADATRPGSDSNAGDLAVRLLEHQATLMGLYPGDS